MVCLCLLQALAAPVSVWLQQGSFRVGALGVVAETNAQSCVTHDSDGAPIGEHRNHAQCCIFCAASGRDASLVFVLAFLGEIAYLAPKRTASILGTLLKDSGARPLGWASSWSSRAPPSHS
ncbi:hypothetical protein MCBRY_002581 [Methylocystis bryophila]|uniref:DUF2946 domain-containing protein n=1 Tax=Methylocystis bryophila TaxID=655015 RepID=A0A1W6MQF3_9HYPH|nr:hypothetical protein B1812_00320 [Methylocystis bryophila]